jgi:predicted PurR-regulated permease PerM
VTGKSSTRNALLLLAIVYTLYFAASLFIPIAIAIFISITCVPVLRILGSFLGNDSAAHTGLIRQT